MKAATHQKRKATKRSSAAARGRAEKLRPLVQATSGGQFTLRQIRAALKAVEEETA